MLRPITWVHVPASFVSIQIATFPLEATARCAARRFVPSMIRPATPARTEPAVGRVSKLTVPRISTSSGAKLERRIVFDEAGLTRSRPEVPSTSTRFP